MAYRYGSGRGGRLGSIPSTRGHASTRLGPGATVFTADLQAFQSCHCELTAALRHVPGLPRCRLIRRLRSNQRCRQTTCLPARNSDGCAGSVPTFTLIGQQGRCPAIPRRPSTSTPPTLLVATPTGLAYRAPGRLAVLTSPVVVRAARHPPQRLLDQAALSSSPAAATARR